MKVKCPKCNEIVEEKDLVYPSKNLKIDRSKSLSELPQKICIFCDAKNSLEDI